MNITFLDEHPEFVPHLAAWCYSEWKQFYGEKTLGDVVDYFSSNRNRERLPITYVAVEANDPLGTITLDVEDLDLRGYENISPWLVCLYVAETARARGIARKLIHHAMAEAVRLKIGTLHLWTENLEDVYGSLGWRVVERTRFHNHDITVMRRDFC
jgi:GNAT superfamily N-acetyltransferase